MDEETKQNIELGAGQAIGIAKTFLPFLKAAIPALARMGGPIGLGVEAAAAILPLIRLIPTSALISNGVQQAQVDELARISVHGFSGPEWEQSEATLPLGLPPTKTGEVTPSDSNRPT